ncbi:hypothetical protein WEH80_00715 [Actinomycetes bacterium KLBMP 9759]
MDPGGVAPGGVVPGRPVGGRVPGAGTGVAPGTGCAPALAPPRAAGVVKNPAPWLLPTGIPAAPTAGDAAARLTGRSTTEAGSTNAGPSWPSYWPYRLRLPSGVPSPAMVPCAPASASACGRRESWSIDGPKTAPIANSAQAAVEALRTLWRCGGGAGRSIGISGGGSRCFRGFNRPGAACGPRPSRRRMAATDTATSSST